MHTSPTRLRIWDWPLRLFHWLLAASTLGMLVTATIGGNAMEWHLRLGHVVLALLLFRVLWGLKGGYWARFSTFLPTPARVLRYLRGHTTSADHAGHSPLGALAVIAMLLLLALQVGTGLVSDDEIAFAGSLVRHVSADTIQWATRWHSGWGQWLIWGILALHLLAVAFYTLVRKKRLIAAMLHGDKTLPQSASTPATGDATPPALPASQDGPGQWLVAVIFAFACAIMAYWVWTQGLL